MKHIKEVEAFGKRLRELRKEANLSQQELAWEADLGLRTIQRIEAGENAASIDVIFAIAKALKITPNKLFEDRQI